jgi:malate/lactate dehydrogenase
MGKTSAGSAANAACDHMRDWWLGTKEGEFVNMGVISDGNPYGVEAGINFSFPVHIKAGGEWKFVEGLKVEGKALESLKINERDLLEERKIAMSLE